ncbi:Zinc finger CCCH domain-containing protein 17 [Hibiscus syriacus]|uniref:Zinc finger CCCH domain-containing protein 17 n=1 Tax=Hibiscus syriacus TaxID=106335 RepID=A0A6A2YSM8_HIBSY|nr:Zinc finger CCCH domain-containing protein 17 [Hibiscus syriacus]
MDLDGGNRRVFNRLGGPSAALPPDSSKNQKVCYHWRAGKCSRFPCPFLHRELPHPSGPTSAVANGSGAPKCFSGDSGFSGPTPRRGPNFNNNRNNNWGRMGANKVVRKTEKVCNYWVQGNCSYGDRCKFLHSWNLGEEFTLLNHLDGHQKVVTGIALPAGMDKLYTGSKDETVRVWDTNTGQCIGVLNLGGEVGCMISEGPWLFVGVPNVVKAWNTQTNQELSLSGPAGQVYTLVVGNDLLFAGTQDGTILVWKFNVVTNSFESAASLKGHTVAVVSLVVGANRLYSGSMDHSIKAWSLETLQCLQTLTEHTNVVMSLLCWEQFLLSCSLDQTIKVWVATENGNLKVTYTHNEENVRGFFIQYASYF